MTAQEHSPSTTDRSGNVAQDATIAFCRSVLDIHPKKPEETVRELTAAWRVLSQACWVWVWLKNTAPQLKDVAPPVNQWELVCDETLDANGQAPCLPREMTMPSDCLSDYSAVCQEVLIVDNFNDTRFVHDGKEYRCGVADDLAEKQCKTLIVVPLLAEDPSSTERGIVGSVCLHFRRDKDAVLQHKVLADQELLRMMGQMTAHVLRTAFQYKFLSVLVQLNHNATQCMARFGRAKESRAEYLEKLTFLIRDSVHVAYVSIFYEQPYARSIQCLATTGLFKQDPNGQWEQVKQAQIPTIRYGANEGLTGECYADGQVYQKPSNVLVPHARKYVEHSLTSGDPRSFILIPILPSEPGQGQGPDVTKAKGVIRVSGHTDRRYQDYYQGHDRNFNSIEVETLRFIAAQIAPVLETFQFRIQREHAVGIIKHELYAPLKMIRDTCDQVIQDLAAMRQVRQQDLEDISTSCLFAENLIPQLSEDPQAASPLDAKKTFLEGDIVARVKNMLNHFAHEAKGMFIEFGIFRDKQDPAKSIPPLMVDPVLVERVLCNLIINAVKYGQRDTKILVDPYLVRPGEPNCQPGLYIEVSNYGIGIEPDEQSMIFEPYYRTDHAKTVAQGAGLGLTIGSNIMKQHGGHLRLIRPTDPTIFQMYFPQALIC